jgi:DNA-binding XRE family transcriptional regulator
MKNKQQNQAKKLYTTTNLPKTEIAQKVGVNRRTIMLWAKKYNWDQLRLSAHNKPFQVAEKCDRFIEQYLTGLLKEGEPATTPDLRFQQAQSLYMLVTAANKLRAKNTANDYPCNSVAA